MIMSRTPRQDWPIRRRRPLRWFMCDDIGGLDDAPAPPQSDQPSDRCAVGGGGCSLFFFHRSRLPSCCLPSVADGGEPTNLSSSLRKSTLQTPQLDNLSYYPFEIGEQRLGYKRLGYMCKRCMSSIGDSVAISQ